LLKRLSWAAEAVDGPDSIRLLAKKAGKGRLVRQSRYRLRAALEIAYTFMVSLEIWPI
jgi:hypothetical protein